MIDVLSLSLNDSQLKACHKWLRFFRELVQNWFCISLFSSFGSTYFGGTRPAKRTSIDQQLPPNADQSEPLQMHHSHSNTEQIQHWQQYLRNICNFEQGDWNWFTLKGSQEGLLVLSYTPRVLHDVREVFFIFNAQTEALVVELELHPRDLVLSHVGGAGSERLEEGAQHVLLRRLACSGRNNTQGAFNLREI